MTLHYHRIKHLNNVFFLSRMLRTLSPLKRQRGCYCLIFSQFFNYSPRIHSSVEDLSWDSISHAIHAHGGPSSPNFSGIAKTVISKCSNLKDRDKCEAFTYFVLKDYLIRLSNVCPSVVRRFWRVSELRPQDVLEILLALEYDKVEVGAEMVGYLWGLFNWASGQSLGFEHIPQSCKIMALMLARVRLFGEVELLLSREERRQGFLGDCKDVFDELIEGYVGEFELDRAISVYARMRRLSLVPSMSSYYALIKYLIELNEVELIYNVYVDMIRMGMGMGGSIEEMGIHENVIRLLCVDGKVQESRNLVKKFVNYGIKPSDSVISAISCGYCVKKDYNDLLSFFIDFRVAPDAVAGNKIIFSLGKSFGVDQASVFLQELEELGFCPDEITLGILIGFCCHEGKLKNAFFYLSDTLSRGLKPHIYSYNAILSAMFKEGMWMLTRDVLAEMSDMGITPESSTFRVLLAGFCKARKFDEVKAIVHEMKDHNLVTLSSVEDPLNQGFTFLGLDSLRVRVRRDNNKGFPKTEFYDNLGNGLYLDTNLDEFEKKNSLILDNAIFPNFNSSIIEKCHSSGIESTLMVVDEMTRWGQEMSLPALSSLLGRLSRTPLNVGTINHHLGLMSKSIHQLDQKTLNMLVQVYGKRGFSFKARTLFTGMLRRGYEIENGTYSALLFDSSKKGDLRSFHYFYELTQKSKWSPDSKEGKALLNYACRNQWVNDALELFETILFSTASTDISDIFESLLGELCCKGFSNTATVLLDEFSSRAPVLNLTAYTHLISGFCLEKRLDEALKLFETMVSKNLSPPLDIYSQLIYRLCWTNNFKKAIELKNLCLRHQPSAILPIHGALIRGFCKSGRAEDAGSLFHETLLKGLFPNANVFVSLIECYCQVNNLNKVRELIGFIIRKNFNISVCSYSKVVHAICVKGKFTLAMSFKELMLQVTCLPELLLHNILIFHTSFLRNICLLDEVINALQMKGLQFDDTTYNFVIRGCLLCNDVSRSLHFLMTMMKEDRRPSNHNLREVINCLCCKGELWHALDLCWEMESRGWIHGSSIQNNLVEALLNNGLLQEAVEYLNRISLKDLIPDNIQYDSSIKLLCRHGQLDTAVKLLNIMLQKGNSPASTSYDYLIRGFCNAHKLDTALDFYTEMMHRGLKPTMDTWDVLLCSLSKYGQAEEAENVLKSAILLGETPSRGAFCKVIHRYRAEKNVGKTSDLVKLMQQKGYDPDFDTHWSLVSNLNSSKKENSQGRSFLSGLLSGFGFTRKNPG